MKSSGLRFVIINDIDAPCRRLVAEYIEGVGYCYMNRKDKHLRKFDGMHPRRPTDITDFGFDVDISNGKAVFKRVRESIATYPDGQNRKWQSSEKFGDSFEYPLVRKRKSKREVEIYG
jgi:hypothetical protein